MLSAVAGQVAVVQIDHGQAGTHEPRIVEDPRSRPGVQPDRGRWSSVSSAIDSSTARLLRCVYVFVSRPYTNARRT
jgi:hypothetical protein